MTPGRLKVYRLALSAGLAVLVIIALFARGEVPAAGAITGQTGYEDYCAPCHNHKSRVRDLFVRPPATPGTWTKKQLWRGLRLKTVNLKPRLAHLTAGLSDDQLKEAAAFITGQVKSHQVRVQPAFFETCLMCHSMGEQKSVVRLWKGTSKDFKGAPFDSLNRERLVKLLMRSRHKVVLPSVEISHFAESLSKTALKRIINNMVN